MRKKTTSSPTEYVGGINPVLEALQTEATRIQKIYLARNVEQAKIKDILYLARRNNIPVAFREKHQLDRDRTVNSIAHQGSTGSCKSITVSFFERDPGK